jgi:hypothetical protein
MLSSTSERDKDQVVSRWMKRVSKGAGKVPEKSSNASKITAVRHNILMVDQLWLWCIPGNTESDPDTVITCFPSRTGVEVAQSSDVGESSAEVDDLQGAVLRTQNLHPRALIRDTAGLVSRILTVCCRTLDRHQQIDTVKFMQMFQSTIGEAVSWRSQDGKLLIRYLLK